MVHKHLKKQGFWQQQKFVLKFSKIQTFLCLFFRHKQVLIRSRLSWYMTLVRDKNTLKSLSPKSVPNCQWYSLRLRKQFKKTLQQNQLIFTGTSFLRVKVPFQVERFRETISNQTHSFLNLHLPFQTEYPRKFFKSVNLTVSPCEKNDEDMCYFSHSFHAKKRFTRIQIKSGNKIRWKTSGEKSVWTWV